MEKGKEGREWIQKREGGKGGKIGGRRDGERERERERGGKGRSEGGRGAGRHSFNCIFFTERFVTL